MSCEECRYKFDCPNSYSEVSEHCSFYDKPTLPAYLSLEDVVHKLVRMTACGPSAQIRDVVAQVLDVRPADVETVHHGYWRVQHGGLTPGGNPCYVCSECGGTPHLCGIESARKIHPKYCQDCGAKMDKEQEHE